MALCLFTQTVGCTSFTRKVQSVTRCQLWFDTRGESKVKNGDLLEKYPQDWPRLTSRVWVPHTSVLRVGVCFTFKANSVKGIKTWNEKVKSPTRKTDV